VDLNQFAADLVDVSRKMLLFKVDESLANLSLEYDDAAEREFREIADKLKVEEILKMIEVFLAKKQEIKLSTIPQFPLELAVVELSYGVSREGAKDVASEIKLPPKTNTVFVKKEIPGEVEKKTEAETPVIANPQPVFGGEEKLLNLDIDTIKERWDNVITKVSDYNASLPITVRLSRPLAISGNALKLGTNFKFHKDRLAELKNKMLLEKVLEEVFVKDEEAVKEEEVRGAAENLAEEFGGRVV
jgi:DNA polymerase-3 subunit gamma/tau